MSMALARGEPRPTEHLPRGATVSVDSESDRIAVTVTAPVVNGYLPGLIVSGRAVAAVETS